VTRNNSSSAVRDAGIGSSPACLPRPLIGNSPPGAHLSRLSAWRPGRPNSRLSPPAANSRGTLVLMMRDSIKDVEPDLREMLTTLAVPLPASARGVAMARILLTDGTGPLFNPHSSTNLRNAIRGVTAQLDSAGSADKVVSVSSS
jgi:hypothetical protein